MTQPDTSPVPVPVRVTLTMPSSSDEPHSACTFGTLLKPTKSIDHICHAVSNPSKDEKYSLL